MAVLASGTGGAFFHDNNDLLRGFRELGMAPEILYVLGFAPTDRTPDGRFHNLKVRLNSGKGYSVQARMGYNAMPKPVPAAAQPVSVSRVDSEMASTEIRAELPAEMEWQPNQQKTGIAYVAYIDLTRLKLETRLDRRVQHLTLVAVLRGAAGSLVAGNRCDVDLSLTEASFARLVAAGGFTISLTVKAPPGTYSARGLLLEGIDGKMVTSSQQVTLP
jgi:hypothetical protein